MVYLIRMHAGGVLGGYEAYSTKYQFGQYLIAVCSTRLHFYTDETNAAPCFAWNNKAPDFSFWTVMAYAKHAM